VQPAQLHEENPQFGYLRSFCTRAMPLARDSAGIPQEIR
jgi:hypothetical protein